ncbi:MAG: hypothetical protein IT176_07955 [Acidobacteria bacterium]|nr:hypothetical protein [Acidobacteriota bacterium]
MALQSIESLTVLAAALFAVSCSTPNERAQARLQPEYDPAGKLTLLRFDSDGDARTDMWSYMDGARIVRIEIDSNGDGTIDRWEHYGADQKLAKVGFSREHDGVEDAWSYDDASGAIARIEISTRRDGAVDRIEHYQHDQMVSAEEDTDHQGGVDKWEIYDDGRLVSVAFDTTGRGTPDRRLRYAADGGATLEVDPDGDGVFVASDHRTSAGEAKGAKGLQE